MMALIRALFYALIHLEPIELTIVRRYVDAQKHFIGELYVDGKMIGASCDNLAFNGAILQAPKLCWRYDFTEPMPRNTIRIGGTEPGNHAAAREYIALRRFCTKRYAILNRFVEHVMEKDFAK